MNVLCIHLKINQSLNITLLPKAVGSFGKEMLFSGLKLLAKAVFPRRSLTVVMEKEENARRERGIAIVCYYKEPTLPMI